MRSTVYFLVINRHTKTFAVRWNIFGVYEIDMQQREATIDF